MYFNVNKNKVNDFTYTLSTYSQESIELLDFDKKQIPYNYLSQILTDYIKINEKEFENKNDEIFVYFDNNDNHLGLYLLCIENKSNFDYFVQFNPENKNCELIQDALIIKCFYENTINDNKTNIIIFYNKFEKSKSFNQMINDYLKQGENKIFIWKLNGIPKTSNLNIIIQGYCTLTTEFSVSRY